MKPTPEQVREWVEEAGAKFDPHWGISYNVGAATFERFAELAAQWGADKAQQAPVEEPELPEAVAFINYKVRCNPTPPYEEASREKELGFLRLSYGYAWNDAESLYTAAQMHSFADAKVRAAMAQQATEPELPEAVAWMRPSITENGIVYDSAFRDENGMVHPETRVAQGFKPLYTAPQMHDHYQAGVRVGAARAESMERHGVSGAPEY